MRRLALVLAVAAGLVAGLIQFVPQASTAAGLGDLECTVGVDEGPFDRSYRLSFPRGAALQNGSDDVFIPLAGRETTTGAGAQGQVNFNQVLSTTVTLNYQSFNPRAITGPDPKVIQTSGVLVLDRSTLVGLSGFVVHTLFGGTTASGVVTATNVGCVPVVDP